MSLLSDIQIDLSKFDWQGVSAVSDSLMVLLNIVLIVSVYIGYRQVREALLTRDASLLTWAMERMTAIKADLRLLEGAPAYGTLQQLQSDDFRSPWPPEFEQAAQNVSSELQRLAYMANSGLISKTHFRKMWGPTFAKAWVVLRLWVMYRRFKNGEPLRVEEGAFSRVDFESFAKECTEA